MLYYFAESLNIGQNKERTFINNTTHSLFFFLFHPDRYKNIVFKKGMLLLYWTRVKKNDHHSDKM